MTDSWTDDELPTTPHAEHLYGDGPVLTGEERSAFEGHAAHSPEVQRDIERREQLRAEEMEHLARLRDRVQQGMDEGLTDLESGATMLLNISKARMALAGVGFYPAF